MSVQFVEMLMMSQAASAPSTPTGVSLSTYSGSLVQVNWTNAHSGTKQTKVYRKLLRSGWTLLTPTPLAAGVDEYETGDSAASGYTYGVSTYDPVTGLESSVRTATDLPPDPPTDVEQYVYSGTKIGLEWVNAESLPVRCYRNSVLATTKPAGTTAWDSGYTSGELEVAHYNSSTGQESTRVGPLS